MARSCPSPYPAFVTVSMMGRPESESIAMCTRYPKTNFSRWLSHVHDASLSLRRWRLHRLLSWLGALANLQSLNHAQMIEESRLTFSPLMIPACISLTTITAKISISCPVPASRRTWRTCVLSGILYVITPSTTFLRSRVTSQSGLVFRKRMRSRTLPMLWRYMSSIAANIALGR